MDKNDIECRSCGQADLKIFLDLGKHPLWQIGF